VVQMLSAMPLEQQVSAHGATWLDRALVDDAGGTFRDAGFGHDAQTALVRRRQWLIEQGLAQGNVEHTTYRPDMLSALTRRELSRAGEAIARDTGLRYVEPGRRIEGVYRRSVELASGKFAMIEKSREFTLVPWRPVLERQLGKVVSGIGRNDSISWSLGRQRGGPSVS
jgi:hypothetical protein